MATAFRTPTDYAGLTTAVTGTAIGLVELKSSAETLSASIAEGEDEIGDVIASEVYGQQRKNSCDYVIKDTLPMATACVLGTMSAAFNVLVGGSITTGKGKAPELSVELEGVQDGAVQGATIALPTFSVSPLHKAQILFSAFTLTGEGCKLTDCSAKFGCNLSRGEVYGDTVSHDVQKGYVEVTATVVQTVLATPPVFAQASGWKNTLGSTAAMSESKPEGAYPTFTATFRKDLTTTPAA